ncbi:hypothetical protein SNEBB_002413 [Seison nebaliae]|nr:hypothetical protein SNEBB_002413 [Seison nebaliae]
MALPVNPDIAREYLSSIFINNNDTLLSKTYRNLDTSRLLRLKGDSAHETTELERELAQSPELMEMAMYKYQRPSHHMAQVEVSRSPMKIVKYSEKVTAPQNFNLSSSRKSDTPTNKSAFSSFIDQLKSHKVVIPPFAKFRIFDAKLSYSSDTIHREQILHVKCSFIHINNELCEYGSSYTNEQTGLSDKLAIAQKKWPMINIHIFRSATVSQFIGLCLDKIFQQYPNFHLRSKNLDEYSLYMAEDDGTIDFDLPPLEKTKKIGDFHFGKYALHLPSNDQLCRALNKRLSIR